MLPLLAAAALLAAPALVQARIHSLSIKDDSRFAFSIESFGFVDGGSVDLDIHDVSVKPAGAEVLMGAWRPASPSPGCPLRTAQAHAQRPPPPPTIPPPLPPNPLSPPRLCRLPRHVRGVCQ